MTLKEQTLAVQADTKRIKEAGERMVQECAEDHSPVPVLTKQQKGNPA